MTYREFELAMADAFRAGGYAVTVTPDGADGGVDLVLNRPVELILVQCKHWKVLKVGVKVVRELYGVMAAQGATGGIVATSGRFTQEARGFAASVNVQLLDHDDVIRMLGLQEVTVGPDSVPTSAGTHTSSEGGVPRCPRCGEPMVIRTTRGGENRGEQFWGCPRFPACRGLVPASGAPLGPPPSTTGLRTMTGRAFSRSPRSHGRQRSRSVAARVALLLVLTVVASVVGGGLMLDAITRPLQRLNTAPSATTTQRTDPRIVTSIPVAVAPHQVAVDPGGRRLYVTHLEDKSLTVIDTSTHTVLSTGALDRQPGAIAFDTKTQTLWVTNFNDATVTLVDPSGSTKATINVGQGPVGVAVDASMGKAFVTNSVDKTVSVIDTNTRKVATTKTLAWEPGAVVVDPVKRAVCIVNPSGMRLWYCHDAYLKLTGVIGPSGDSVAIDSVTHSRYATRSATKTLEVVDGATGKSTTIPVGQSPTGVAVDSGTQLAYVTDHDTKRVLVIQTAE